ncbi:MAG TPA: acyltransferase [Planctomycetota bacterium]|nr:acyltransferase [Planctomycetota bacterium]
MNKPVIGRTPSSGEDTEHFAFIDALRGWAFLAVLAVHVHVPVQVPTWLSGAQVAGNYGVQLFFVISALTLFMSYDSRRKRDRNPVAAFFVRRLFRIAPLFWLAIPFYLWHNGVGPRASAPNGIHWPQIVSTSFFLHGWHPTSINSVVPGGWSIATEMTFYLILPLCFRVLPDLRRSIVACGAALVLSIGISLIMRRWLSTLYPVEQTDLIRSFLYFWFPGQLPVFLLGFVLYFLIKRFPRAPGAASSEGSGRGSLLLPSVAIGWTLGMVILHQRVPMAYFLFSCGFVLLGLGLSLRPLSILVNPISRFAGKVSYSAYLTHFFVVEQLTWRISNQGILGQMERHPVLALLLAYLLCLAGTLAISTLTHYLIEVPGQNLGKGLIRRCGWGPAPAPPGDPERIGTTGEVVRPL